jgi:hypothetical protein
MENQVIEEEKEFDVALSFAGEDREYVENVANILHEMSIRVFYDKHETITLWGKDLFTFLEDIYQNKARYTILFCSKHYAKKLWSNHERRAAQAQAFESNKEYILPARFDYTEIPGILPTTGYVNLNEYSPEEFAKLIKEKIGPIRRKKFYPTEPDLLFNALKIRSKKDKKRANFFAYRFFEMLKLMTLEERIFLTKIILESCRDSVDEICQGIDFICRVVGEDANSLLQKLHRIECLDFQVGIITPTEKTCKHEKVIEIKFVPRYEGELTNATDVINQIIEVIFSHCCEDCSWKCVENIDFSPLSSMQGFDETSRKDET